MARIPPGGESQVQQEENSDNTGGTHPQSNQQRDSHQQFDDSNHVAEKYRMRQHKARKYRPVPVQRIVGDVALKVFLEVAMGKVRPSDFVFSKQDKEYGRGHAHHSYRAREGRRNNLDLFRKKGKRSYGLSSGAV